MTWNRSIAAFVLACASTATFAAPCAGYSDVSDTDVEYCAAVTFLKNKAITLGCGDGTQFCPDQATTRQQMALFLKRFADSMPPPVSSSVIAFSSGPLLSGPTVVAAAPILMGFGSSTVETIDSAGESTNPPEVGGFSIPIPFDGVLENLQVSADLLVASVVGINTLGVQYDYTVIRSPSAPNNGIATLAQPYSTTPLSASVRFGFPSTILTAGNFYSATNATPLHLAVFAGDRIGIRVRPTLFSSFATSDVTQLSFSATLTYTH